MQLDPSALDTRQALRKLGPHRHAIVCGLCTGDSNNLKDGIVDRDGVLSCRRLLNERADPPDDLARTITLLYDTSERLAQLAEIRWLRAHPAQAGLRVCDCRSDRLAYFMGGRGRDPTHRGGAFGARPR